LERLLFRQHGVISRRQAMLLMPRAELRRLVDSERWARAHRGVYVSHNGPLTPEQRTWIAVLAVGGGRRAPLAGPSALEACGMLDVTSPTIHVYIPANVRDSDPPEGVVVHRSATLARDDVLEGPPPRTSPARAVVDAARWAEDDVEAHRVIVSAFRQRLVDVGAIDVALSRMRRIRRRDLIVAAVADLTVRR
jgi:hypothetical protein